MKEEITGDGSNAGDRWGWMQCDWMKGIGSWGVGRGEASKGAAQRDCWKGVGLSGLVVEADYRSYIWRGIYI